MRKILFLVTIIILFILEIPHIYALDISINEIKILDKSDDITVGNVTANNLTITPNITFNKINDYVIYKINFKGKDIKKYKIENITDNNKSDNIKITYDHKETLNESLYMIIKYEKEVKDTLSLNDINITINLLGEDNEEEIVIGDPPSGGETPPTNPKTGTLSHIIVPAILIIILVFLIKYYTKHKNDNTLIIVILCLTLIPLSVIAYESQKLTLVLKTSNISISKNDSSEPTKYVVYLYPNGGTGITEGQKFEYTETTLFEKFPNVTKKDCTLVGWNIDSTSGKLYTKDVRPSDDGKKLYANWTCHSSTSNSKILLIAGHSFQPYCLYTSNECRGIAKASGYDEAVETRLFVQEIKRQLISLGYPNNSVDIANELLGENLSDQSTSKSLYVELLKKYNGVSNTMGNIDFSKYAYAIEVHFNAFGEGANGTTTLCSLGDCGSGLNITNDIRNSINNILKTKNRGVSPQVTQNFDFFKSQNIPFTYLETEFYDNKTAMDNFKNNESQVALAIAKCIKKYYP